MVVLAGMGAGTDGRNYKAFRESFVGLDFNKMWTKINVFGPFLQIVDDGLKMARISKPLDLFLNIIFLY